MSQKGKLRRESWDAAPNQPFISVLKPTLQEPAWRDLSFGARCLYVTVKGYYNGKNNGRLYLGVRRAASELNASRSSTEIWFRELQDHGFLRIHQPAFLGAEGRATATFWRLTEIGCNGERPTCDYKSWSPSDPKTSRKSGRSKNKTPHRKSGQTVPKIGTGRTENRDTCPENRDGFSNFSTPDRPENRCISTLPGVGGREDARAA